jgi:hypothetical protein
MDYFTGGGLIVLGLVILIFGRTAPARPSAVGVRATRWKHWINLALTWAIGVVCVWFGAATLITGTIQF